MSASNTPSSAMNQPGDSCNTNVVPVAVTGFGKGGSQYDTYRPGYTDQGIDVVVSEIKSSTPAPDSISYEVLELGAGTGKFTEGLVPKLPPSFRYLATEPSRDFLDCLEAKGLPVKTAQASANAIPVLDNSVAVIVCAQCLHWFSTEECLEEMHRVLVPGGKIIPIWNVKQFHEDWPTEVYKQRLIVMEKTGSSLKYLVNSMEWYKTFEKSDLFSEFRHEILPGIVQSGNLDSVINNLRTISVYNNLGKEEQQRYLEELKEAILKWPGVNPDNMAIPFKTWIYIFEAK